LIFLPRLVVEAGACENGCGMGGSVPQRRRSRTLSR
jgi:hypothetical protein